MEEHIAKLSAALYEQGLFTEAVGAGIVNVHSADTCDEASYLYTLTLSVTP